MHTFVERIYDFYVLSWKCYIITDSVKTSHSFHVILIELKRQKHMYSIILPESKKIMSSKIILK